MFVRIIDIPPGCATEDMRRAWVGLTLKLATDEEVAEQARLRRTDIPEDYVVRGRDAVDALFDAGKLEAAAYWCRPVCPSYLEFAREVCEEIG
ncbi:MAG: hypothetical protein ABIT47_03695 [Candidatus Paceibacterota bacterium]